MGSVLRVRLSDGTVIDVPAIMGTPGKDGYTPVKGVDYTDGKDGKDGEDGYTPVKGTDYWTEDEKTEIINEVIAMLPVAEGVGF